MPGTYDAALGETFPIRLQQGQSLVGDVPSKGAGATATAVYGSGDVDPTPGNDYLAVFVGAGGSSVAGFSIGAPYAHATYSIYVVDAAVSISDNTFTSVPTNLYAGVLAIGNGASSIMHNDFLTASYGVFGINCTGGMVVESNLFQGMSIPININGASNNPVIRGNTIIGTGHLGIQVQGGGTPLIENNTFNKPGGFATYGAIRCSSSSANPTVRGNTFTCALGVGILNAATPDLGSVSQPGGNNFSGVTGAAIYHEGSSSISAVGNTWASPPPDCGSDIVVTGTGSVIWGTGVGESCP